MPPSAALHDPSEPAATLIRCSHLSFSYGDHLILDDVSLTVQSGDFLAIIGPNGSGKSTLVKLILGLMLPDTGDIELLGRRIGDFDEWHLIGYVPQKATHVDPLFPISASEVVELGRLSAKSFPRWLGLEDKLAVQQSLSRVGMKRYAGRRMGALSGGQQQRVFIARAIVNRPQILFLDEPTTGIDTQTQERFYGMLDELNRQGLGIVLVTHDIGVVNKHVNKVACLNQRLVFHGTHADFCSSDQAQALIPGQNHLILHRH